MNGLPEFLAKTDKRASVANSVSICSYQPLLAAWAIEILLLTGGHLNMINKSHNLIDSDFAKLTGISIDEKELAITSNPSLSVNGKNIPVTAQAIAKELTRCAAEYRNQPIHDELYVFGNVRLLGSVLGLNRAEQAVLCFVAMLHKVQLFKDALERLDLDIPLNRAAIIIAQLTGNKESEIHTALMPQSILRSYKIIEINHYRGRIDDLFSLDGVFVELLSRPLDSTDTLIAQFFKQSTGTKLSQLNFPHLKQEITVLKPYIEAVMKGRQMGCNVLLYGIPGTGKTEFAKVLAAELGVDLYEVSFAAEDGTPIDGAARLRAYNLCQRILAGRNNALLVFDEIEDVFPKAGLLQWLSADDKEIGRGTNTKAWVNRMLEQNSTPAIWITNDAHLDEAYLRRFDYSVRFAVPPIAVRKEIVRQYLGRFNPSEAWLAGIADNEQFTPSQYDRAAKVARLGAPDDSVRALALAEKVLDCSAMLLGQKTIQSRNLRHTHYDLKFTNTSMPLEKILEGLFNRRMGTFCFYGPAGTGKSEFARHIADCLGMPCIVRRASDILSMWVGGSEKNIAMMFAEARQQEAILVLDEADSFLADRRDAKQSWEVTQVNELLTQMEAFDGIFVCTTNLMDSLDQASLRRFAFKLKFDYLNVDQRWEMFQQECRRMGGKDEEIPMWENQVKQLAKLTPGDFAVVARQFGILGTQISAGEMYRQLSAECLLKGGAIGKIGFVG